MEYEAFKLWILCDLYWPWPLSNGVWATGSLLLPTSTIGGLGRKGGEEEEDTLPTISLVLGLHAPPPPTKGEVSETRHCSAPKKPSDEDLQY